MAMAPPELQFFSEVQDEVSRLKELPIPPAITCGAHRMRQQQDKVEADGMESLIGSVLMARSGSEFPGGGLYRLVRCAPSMAKFSGSQPLLSVSTRGGATDVHLAMQPGCINTSVRCCWGGCRTTRRPAAIVAPVWTLSRPTAQCASSQSLRLRQRCGAA